MMKLDLLTCRVLLRSIQQGLVLEEALHLVEGALDGFESCEDVLVYGMQQALQGTPVSVVQQARPTDGKEESNHGQ